MRYIITFETEEELTEEEMIELYDCVGQFGDAIEIEEE